MILRKPVPVAHGPRSDADKAPGAGEEIVEPARESGSAPPSVTTLDELEYRTPLRWRLSLLTAGMVALAVGAMSLIAYWTISTSVSAAVDRELDETATALLERSMDPMFLADMDSEIEQFKAYNPGTRISVSPPGWTFSVGDSIPAAGEPVPGADGTATSVTTVDGERILSKSDNFGGSVVLARDIDGTQELITSLGVVMLVIALLGVVLAVTAGTLVAAAGLRPLSRLQRAVDYVTWTDDLRPIPVMGNDEVAQLAHSFNAMLKALEESRARQTRLVADAGHELKTPLTSMRTNLELLFLARKNNGPHGLSEQDRLELKQDVIAQMEEMSTLIGDLVDLAREDSAEKVMEDVELEDVIETSLSRVRRRRPDVEFSVHTIPWLLHGDEDALNRAVVNLMDNAAKWSPKGGTVRIRLWQVDDETAELSVADSGPGIPAENHERVFERFYRAPEARSTPGSGLGLAIVKQVIERHGGSISIRSSADGGTDMRVRLPGTLVQGDRELAAGDVVSVAPSSAARSRMFMERWRKRDHG
ncbi:HAMP domain-containing sensor histidine kinase [Corynebacterium halotolerans]|uniref:histidine kinase n=1 Tax=Corynebacterium halotolerans YIM 70093 = DSM 44683 TaxID=1121362 RepID=M1P5E6_9CORY|nr:HAMP domain-containing sensor histidine kinase [Corynebacterium halotolerans]AGF71881.1 Two component system sensor kinase protein [Corynebacterium halotolerans YIM 70093 = DSM 44683]